MPETMIISYKYRLLPTKSQHACLREILESQRILYNAALEERIGCYKKTGKGRSYMDQCKGLTEWRKEESEVTVNMQRWTLKRLDDAYSAFFKRLKKGSGKAGFPRFRGKGWWKSFGFAEFSGIGLKEGKLRFKGLAGALRIHMHRPLPVDADIRSCVITKDLKGWSVSLQIKIPCADTKEVITSIGVDVGLMAFATMSDGSSIPNPRIARKAQKRLRLLQRKFSRCKRNSKNRNKARAAVARAHLKIANTRDTFLHQASAGMVNRFDAIAVEKLQVKNMGHGTMAKSIHDASWSKWFGQLRYKAERAGTQVAAVDPRYTSQTCSGCGVIVKKQLQDRVHDCKDCGLVLDRDHNAAINILERGKEQFVGVVAHREANVEQWFKRSPRNAILELAA